jgi:hypothetical protein
VVALTLIRSGRHSSIALKAVIGIASVVDDIVVPTLEFVISHYAINNKARGVLKI